MKRKLIFVIIMLGYLIVNSDLTAQVLPDSLMNEIKLMENKNDQLTIKVDSLIAENNKAVRAVGQERRNIKYLFAAYSIIMILMLGIVIRHYQRVHMLLQEIDMLKSSLDDITKAKK